MNLIEEHISKLGLEATDKVSGMKGVLTTLSFDLYGCVQYVLTASKLDKEGKPVGGHWMDVSRLTIGNKRAMDTPNFKEGMIALGNKGPAEKPAL